MDRIDRMDRMDRMGHEKPSGCPPHGAGLRVESLVGRRLVEVVAAWQEVGGSEVVGPLDVWLIDDGGDSVHVTTGSDWCLIVEAAQPYGDYDLGASGRVRVGAVGDETPFAEYVGECVVGVREEHEPNTGRVALEPVFARGRVRCARWGGDLLLA
jgi:hypothetical protein